MSELKTKLCPSCEETKDVSEFIRPSNGTRSNLYKICNDCWQYERKLERIRENRSLNSLTPTKPKVKIVREMIYRSSH